MNKVQQQTLKLKLRSKKKLNSHFKSSFIFLKKQNSFLKKKVDYFLFFFQKFLNFKKFNKLLSNDLKIFSELDLNQTKFKMVYFHNLIAFFF